MRGPLLTLGVALFAATAPGDPPDAPPNDPPDSPPVVTVDSATWGGACGAPEGNATDLVAAACDGDEVCLYEVDPIALGDPVPGCDEDLTVHLACGDDRDHPVVEAARGERAVLACTDVIDVVEATYGASCGAADGNATAHLAGACEGRARCEYEIDFRALGDPAPGCAKDWRARWRCTATGVTHALEVPAEAGWRTRVELSCPAPADAPSES